MTQNTEQNVRTRAEQLAIYPESVCVGRYSGDTLQLELDGDDLDADLLVEGPVLYVRCDIAHRSQTEAEARGAAEARRTDATTVEIVRQYQRSDGFWQDVISDDVWKRIGRTKRRTLSTCPAEISSMALERDRLRKYFDEVEKLLSETRKIQSRFMRIRASLTPPRDSRREV